MKKAYSLIGIAALAASLNSQAAVLFSTGWDSPTSTSNDAVLMNGTSRSASITGAGANAPSPAGFWTVTNAAQVDLSSATFITNGTNNVGATSGTDILRKGAVFTTGTDFAYDIGASNSTIRYATSTGVWAPQMNATAPNDARFNVLFEIGSGVSFDDWNVSFNYGTASTSLVWNSNTALQNGTADVDIYSVAGDGTLTLTGLTFTGTSIAGASPLASLDADNSATSLASGTYLLSISLTGKTLAQRYTIDNLVVSAVVVPEPATWALLAGSMTTLLVFRRRRG